MSGIRKRGKRSVESGVRLHELSNDPKQLSSFLYYQMCDFSFKPKVVQYFVVDESDTEQAVNKSTIEEEVEELCQTVLPGGKNERNVLYGFTCSFDDNGGYGEWRTYKNIVRIQSLPTLTEQE